MKPWSRRLEALEAAVADLGLEPDSCVACLPPVESAIFVRQLDEEIPRCPSCSKEVDQNGRRVIGQIVVIDLGSEERAAIAHAKREAEESAEKERARQAGEAPPA